MTSWFDIAGLAGVVLIVIAYLLLQLEKLPSSAPSYSLLNALGDYKRPTSMMLWSPSLRAYRRSPEFKAHAIASGLPEYWRKHGFPPQCRPVGSNDFKCE